MTVSPPAQPFNILIVDDIPDNLRLLVGLLTEQGYKTRPVPSGKLALTAAQGMPPDLILLDIKMPDMDGYTVCEQLKADVRTADIPVIFLSALNDVFDKVRAFQVGGIDYVTKPFQAEEVLARIQTHLTLRSLQTHLQQKNQHLEQTLQQLHQTQAQLIQSEKMAALGQLVAGVAHEMNSPLGAIRSSIEHIAHVLDHHLESLPEFLRSLSPQQAQTLIRLIQQAKAWGGAIVHASSREKRQWKRQILPELEAIGLKDAELLADTLVDLGAHQDLATVLPLLQESQGRAILETAYQITSLQRSTQTIHTAADRAAKVVFALRSYAYHDLKGEKVKTHLIEGLDTALTLYQNHLKHGVEVLKDYPDQLSPFLGYADELNQVWMNLIQNALQAMTYRGTLTLAVHPHPQGFLIQITDTGKGIDPEILPRIFDPFFTTKPMGEGTGLGLSIVKKIIDKHNGTIEVSSVPGQTVFSIFLPGGEWGGGSGE